MGFINLNDQYEEYKKLLYQLNSEKALSEEYNVFPVRELVINYINYINSCTKNDKIIGSYADSSNSSDYSSSCIKACEMLGFHISELDIIMDGIKLALFDYSGVKNITMLLYDGRLSTILYKIPVDPIITKIDSHETIESHILANDTRNNIIHIKLYDNNITIFTHHYRCSFRSRDINSLKVFKVFYSMCKEKHYI